MADLSADIIVRTQQVDQKLRSSGAKFDQFGKKAASGVRGVSDVLDDIPPKLDDVNRKVKSSSVIWFQAGQAISDFAVAGPLGAANNIEFLAAQMGVGGPLLAGVAVATTAFIVFGDDIARAFAPVNQRVDELKESFGELLNVIEGPDADRSIFLFDTQLPSAIAETRAEIEKLEADLKQSRLFGTGATIVGLLGGIRNPFADITPTEEELGRTKAFLQELEARLEKINNNQSAFEKGLASRQSQIAQTAAASLRFDLERAGLQDKIKDIGDDELLQMERKVGFERLVADLRGKGAREQLTLLEKARESNERLKEQLMALRDTENSRLGQILQQNQQLQEQIRIVKRLNAERAKNDGSLGVNVSSVSGAGFDTTPQPIGELIGDLQKREAEQRKNLLSPRLLDDEVVNQYENAADRYINASLRMKEANEQLASSIETGVQGAITSLATSIGSGDSMFDALRESIGSFAVQVGQTLIGFGTAGLGLQTFITNPAGAIIAGTALVGLGSALKSSVSKQTSSFAASGAAGAPDQPGRIDPRAGRRFQRGYEPIAPTTLLDRLNLIGQFTLRGEDLTASVDTTRRRQGRTREAGTRG